MAEPIDTRTQPIDAWLDALASKTPAPGGGAAAALVGGVAAALGSMVLAYTRGKKAFAEIDAELADVQARLVRYRQLLLELADEDARAYAVLNALMRLPEDDPARRDGWEEAVHDAINVPRAGVAACASLAAALESLVGRSNRWLGSDLAIAAELAAASASAFAWNVRVNLPQLTDAADREDDGPSEGAGSRHAIEAETEEVLARARRSAAVVASAVSDELARGD